MKRIAPTANDVPLRIKLDNDFQRFHSACTIIPKEKKQKVAPSSEDTQGDKYDAVIREQEILHTNMVNDFDRGHEEFMEGLDDDMDVGHTIESILEYHNFMIGRFEEYKEQCLALEERFQSSTCEGDGVEKCDDDACEDSSCSNAKRRRCDSEASEGKRGE